jgi:hypothetical protein
MSGTQDQIDDWGAAYRNAEYRVLLAAGELVLRVGVHRTEDDARLREECGVRERWAVLTPCNPGSRVLGAGDNRRRLSQLAAILHGQQVRHHHAVNCDPAGRWPDEPGFLLCDPLPGLAESLGRGYAQNAILSARLGAAAELCWLA